MVPPEAEETASISGSQCVSVTSTTSALPAPPASGISVSAAGTVELTANSSSGGGGFVIHQEMTGLEEGIRERRMTATIGRVEKMLHHIGKMILTIFLTTVMIFITIMDIFGNTLVILSILRNKKLRNAGNVFVISLSSADLMVGLYSYPLISIATFCNKWILGDLQCKISGVIHTLSFIVSVYNIMAIAINRYCCICHSLIYDRVYSMKNTCCYVLLIWIFSIILLLPIMFFDVLQYDERVHFCAFIFAANPSLTSTLGVIHFLIPTTIVIFCYSRIWILVIQVKYRVRERKRQKLKSNEVRNFLTMFAVFVLFAICWCPFSIPSLVEALNPRGKASEFPVWLYVLGYFTASFNNCLNGIVYGVLNKNFRQEYKRILLLCTIMLP
ncbi:melatonin receptor type 1C-like [Protopterus annectens]|uniref:melatonin receptor type 1C-like n=1 Tax=Protopterus annectens TaxID=7888 RepID=UPI001CFBA9E6|nr:melatonin receptor type 1C-like [Protopterus annectens]